MKDVRWRLAMAGLTVGSYGVCSAVLGYPWQLALLTSFAVVALAYAARRTVHEQRRLYRTLSSDPFSVERDVEEAAEEGDGESEGVDSSSPVGS